MSTSKVIPGLYGVCWQVTNTCNMACPICYAPHTTVSFQDNSKLILNSLLELGLRKILFTGGEPLLASPLLELMHQVKAAGIKTGLTTNGLLLDDAWIAKLEDNLDELTLPLDGATEATHLIHRGTLGHFEKMMSLINRAWQLPIPINISSVFTSFNQHESLHMLKLLENKRINEWKLFQYSTLGSAKETSNRFILSNNKFRKLVDEIVISVRKVKVIARFGDTNTMKSYLIVAPDGTALLPDESGYQNLGPIWERQRLERNLQQYGFNYKEHKRRHKADLVIEA